MNSELTFKAGVKDVVPTLFGYIGVGIAFGIIGHTSHLSILMIAFMSFWVYAGSAQFIIANMILVHDPISAIAISTFLVNSRMILMATTLAQYFRKDSILNNIGIGILTTDETFALAMNKLNRTKQHLTARWQHAANLLAYLIWILATIVGAWIGSLISSPEKFGLDFALVAMFIGLVYLQLITDKTKGFRTQLLVMLFVVICLYFSMAVMSANIAVLFSTILGCAFGMVIDK
ncbi:AzlC family ABC transporter permease [Secundilactobacillus malefermentans]|uniref:Azaleucine resistance protein AzlC n=1 Tax=Secundilactobacillus malefermentans TaxID=176292 RepID=A0A4R5ND93_9LACO|nr:AzlC family ABC transporter permease [Secundilactobacillus malefermentans]KRM58644.1 amino acid transport protein [Secundilactobacillus malefermentans DSM 5705 = KCTC 3548]QEA31030.1 AzlC family ABC transporter permease [Secundilactobacillus malefermentans]TDG71341.1 hypothetical protein C5L31_001965 [Secundilactobacillus malefermentans]